MPPVGFQPGAEKQWWWKVALHLDEAQIALANAVAHNVDDARLPNTLYDKLREGQGVLLQIVAAKGLMPNGANGASAAPSSVMSEPAVPEHMITDAEIVDGPAAPYTEGLVVEADVVEAAPEAPAAPVEADPPDTVTAASGDAVGDVAAGEVDAAPGDEPVADVSVAAVVDERVT